MIIEQDSSTQWYITNKSGISQAMPFENLELLSTMNAAQILGAIHRNPRFNPEKETLLRMIEEEGGGIEPVEELKRSLEDHGFSGAPPLPSSS